jgi:hypothetical protein
VPVLLWYGMGTRPASGCQVEFDRIASVECNSARVNITKVQVTQEKQDYISTGTDCILSVLYHTRIRVEKAFKIHNQKVFKI